MPRPALAALLLSPLALASAPLPEDSIESRRVHQLVEQLERAVNRADTGAYMALVDTADPVFATEQRAWAADLLAHPVEDVDFAIAWGQPVRLLDDGSAVAAMEISWHIPGEELDRHFAYDALFRPIGAANGQWVFAGRAWEVSLLSAPGVRVYADARHEPLARLAMSRVPVLRQAIADNMGHSVHEGSGIHEVVVKIYPDMESLQASIYLSYTDPLGGWNEPGESIKIRGREEFSQDAIDPLLAHEIGHAVSFEFGPKIIDAPWWTLEGVAEVAAGLFSDVREAKRRRIARLAERGDLRDWDLLADFRGEANNHAMHVYLQGWSMVDYIDQTFGLGARNAWFTRLAAGATLDQSTRDALGMPFDQLDAQWRASLLDGRDDAGQEN